MAILIRVAALFAFLGLSRVTHAKAPPIVYEIDRLSWDNKARLIWRLTRDTRVPLWTRVIVLAPAFYLMSPIDLLPDFIPFLGRLDDAAIFRISIDLLAWSTPSEVIEHHLERVRA